MGGGPRQAVARVQGGVGQGAPRPLAGREPLRFGAGLESGADGAAVVGAHTADIYPSTLPGIYYGLSDSGPVILDNQAVWNIVSYSGSAITYNDLETAFGLTFPYKMWMTATCPSTPGQFLQFGIDGEGSASKMYIQLKSDGTVLISCRAYDLDGNLVFTHNTSYTAATGIEHTIALYVEETQMTVIVDDVPAAIIEGSPPIDGAYISVRIFPTSAEGPTGTINAVGIDK